MIEVATTLIHGDAGNHQWFKIGNEAQLTDPVWLELRAAAATEAPGRKAID